MFLAKNISLEKSLRVKKVTCFVENYLVSEKKSEILTVWSNYGNLQGTLKFFKAEISILCLESKKVQVLMYTFSTHDSRLFQNTYEIQNVIFYNKVSCREIRINSMVQGPTYVIWDDNFCTFRMLLALCCTPVFFNRSREPFRLIPLVWK